MTSSIYAAQAEQFAAEGYAVFPGVLNGAIGNRILGKGEEGH